MDDTLKILISMVERLSFQNGELRGVINLVLEIPEAITDETIRENLSILVNQ